VSTEVTFKSQQNPHLISTSLFQTLQVIEYVKSYTSLTMGNHDIGHPDTIDLMRQKFIRSWHGRYLTANSYWSQDNTTLGAPYYVATTAMGRKVLVLGYMFNFTQYANNTCKWKERESE
jgi:hypothetical protein